MHIQHHHHHEGQETNYLKFLHSHAKGIIYFLGIALMSLGALISNLALFASFGFWGVFGLFFSIPFNVLYIIGFWMLFYSGRNSRSVNVPLTLFKIHIIISIVLLSFSFVVMFFTVIGTFAVSSYYFGTDGSFLLMVGIVTMAIVGAIMVLFVIFYHGALLRIIKSIKSNIKTNSFGVIKGVIPFTVTSVILIIISVAYSIYGLLTLSESIPVMVDGLSVTMHELTEFLGYVAWDFVHLYDALATYFTLVYIAVFVSLAGQVFCIIALNRFAGRKQA